MNFDALREYVEVLENRNNRNATSKWHNILVTEIPDGIHVEKSRRNGEREAYDITYDAKTDIGCRLSYCNIIQKPGLIRCPECNQEYTQYAVAPLTDSLPKHQCEFACV